MYNSKNIPIILKAVRKELKLTQSQLSAIMNYNERLISHYETGKREPSLSYLIKLSEIAGLELRDLLGPDEVFFKISRSIQITPTHAELDLIAKLRKMPPAVKSAFILTINFSSGKKQ